MRISDWSSDVCSSDLQYRIVAVHYLADDHRKLVATQSGHGIGTAHYRLQALGNRLQQLIANAMATRIVDVLEAVQIDEQQRQRAVAAPTKRNRLIDAIKKQAAVGQPGEAVVQRQLRSEEHTSELQSLMR